MDNRITGHDTQNFEISWEDLFIELGEGIYRESDEYQIVQGFRHTIGEKENKDYNDIEVKDLYIEQARHQLEALDLIKAVRKGGGMTGIAWTFTDKGRRYLSHLKALRACLKRVLHSGWLHDSPRQLQLMW